MMARGWKNSAVGNKVDSGKNEIRQGQTSLCHSKLMP